MRDTIIRLFATAAFFLLPCAAGFAAPPAPKAAADKAPAYVDDDRPIEDLIYWNTNFDDTHTPQSAAALTKFLPPTLGFVAGVREAGVGPNSTKSNPRPVWDWNSMAWLRDIYQRPWMQGRGMLMESIGSTVYEGDKPYGEEWEDNIRWKYYNLAKQFPTQVNGITGWCHANEPDNGPLPGQGFNFVRDFKDKKSPEARQASLERNVRYARVMNEQLRAVKQPDDMKAPAHPGFIIGPCAAFPSYERQPGVGNQVWSSKEFLPFNGGEVLDYYEAVDWHYHCVGCSEVETFDDRPPAHMYSPYHIWHALSDAHAARKAAGRPERLLPMVTGETGWGEKNVSYYPPGGRNAKTVYYPDLEAYKGYKLGSQYCGLLWYGLSMWANYSMVNSHAATDYNELSPDYKPKSHYFVSIDILDWRKYDINNLKEYPLQFAAKKWQDYNRPYSWAVHFAASRYPTKADFPPAPAFPEWRAATFQDGALVMGPRDGRNLAYRPIFLRRLVPHVFEVDVKVADGATAKLRARGYDKLDGRAQIVDTTKKSGTLRVEFTPRQHGMGHGLPDPAYVLIALDHDGKGTVTWSNPRITVQAPEEK